MIDFRTPVIGDRDWIRKRTAEMGCPSCEYTFGNIFSYTAKMDIKVAEIYGCLVTRCIFGDSVLYCYPMGNGDRKKAVEELVQDGLGSGKDFVFFGLTRDFAEELESFYPGRFNIEFDRDGSDYLYYSEDLINLSGKKYQPKRNHISYFEKNYNWEYEVITNDNIPECIDMNSRWIETALAEFREDLEYEFEIIKLAFANYDALGLKGGLIRVDGEVIAFTVGEEMNENTFCVHFEKAFSSYRGAYPIINREFCKRELSSYKYIDREDDVGAENLRKAKLSYHPAIIREEYEAKLKNVD
ncbi:MAG: DUF2156 domain-containing protein [Ruminococcaceae bacterium]|nr:DUF2156 domain-containing protein [Oscillospiraceae bacterium]